MPLGPHFNPFGKTHAGPKVSLYHQLLLLWYNIKDEIRHVGDLGNVTADADGIAKFELTDNMVKV